MRHNKKFNHLGRTSAHRKATLANLASSLVLHKRIETTVAKAKALKIYVEPLVTKSKEDTTHSRRVVFSYLKDKYATAELFRTVAPAVGDRPGGYTRILKTGFRVGDAADMCIIELVDFNETYKAGATVSGAGKARTRRGGKSAAAQKEATDGVSDAVVVEEGAEGAEGVEAPETQAKPVKKAAPKKAAAPAKPKGPAAPKGAVKTSGSKASAGRSVATKKG